MDEGREIEIVVFRFRYLSSTGSKVVEIMRQPVHFNPAFWAAHSGIMFPNLGNESPDHTYQTLRILPVTDSDLFGDSPDAHTSPHRDRADEVVDQTFLKDDLRIRRRWWCWEVDVPTSAGVFVTAKFFGRLKRGRYVSLVRQVETHGSTKRRRVTRVVVTIA
jgi:hypothetical protein